MDIKKCIACAAAMALLGGAMTINAVENPVIPSFFASAEEKTTVVEIAHVGEKYSVNLGNTSGTAVWTSADEKIATVKSTGALSAEITGVSVGTTTVYASVADQSLAFTVKVLAEAESQEQTIKLPDLVFSATQNTANINLTGAEASEFTWSSSDESVAVVDAAGTITAKGKGSCVITAVRDKTTYIINVTSNYESSSDLPGDFTVVEQDQVVELSNEKSVQKIGIGELPDGITPAWGTTDSAVARVDQNGVVTATGAGECKVLVQLGKTIYSFKVVSTFDPAQGIPEVELANITLSDKNPTRQIDLNAEDLSAVTWSSSDESIAIVDDKGLVTAKGSGNCRIIANYGGKNYIIEVESTYTGKEPELPVAEIAGVGNTIQLSGEGAKSWSSSDESVATVDSNGLVTAKGLGEAIITAHFDNGYSSVKVVVGQKILYGDANDDGSITLNDAVAILQYIALSSKYPLTEQGLKNADCCDPGKGISGGDALAIQMLDAKVISALPLITQ